MRCSQRCSQRVFVLKTKAPQVADLRRQVELEGIEPSTSSMPSMVRIDQQSSRKGLVLEDHADGFRIEPLRPVGPQLARAIYRTSGSWRMSPTPSFSDRVELMMG